MPRQPIPLAVPDVSAFARALATGLAQHQAEHGAPPAHQALLNLLARAAGQRNHQAVRATAPPRLATPVDHPRAAPPLTAHAAKALSQFDTRGRLVRWPHKYSVQVLALWVLWMQFDGRRVYTEREVNEVLKAWHSYGDHATLRRELINHGLMQRKDDCSEYRKCAQRPGDEVRALLVAWRALVPRRTGMRFTQAPMS
jgi:hypothetical protein